jgi:hypothetical protein
MRVLYGLISVLALATAGAREVTAPRVTNEIIALELQLCGLLERGAFDEYATHITQDYTLTTPQGQFLTREEALASWRSIGPGYKMTPSEMRVRVYGNTAILTARVVGPTGGSGDRITKTFVRIKGKWLLAALHVSDIAEPRK